MISGAELIIIIVVAVGLYLVFKVIPMPIELRNILGIILAIVLVAILVNMLLGVFPL